ncbi:MAG TPA: hypothetical protein VMW62_06810 [Chloroflexota bacterium]|nr:hypothetical protein [Chloroflexota bacterium]
MKTSKGLPVANWEYREFDIPTEDRERVFLGWLREGWELIGIHPKGKGQRKALPVAIVRRELAPLPDPALLQRAGA